MLIFEEIDMALTDSWLRSVSFSVPVSLGWKRDRIDIGTYPDPLKRSFKTALIELFLLVLSGRQQEYRTYRVNFGSWAMLSYACGSGFHKRGSICLSLAPNL